MATFESLLETEAAGAAWLLEVSTDDFATVAYRWATATLETGGNLFEKRISKMGKLQRGFGNDGMPAPSRISFEIDNTDGAADWLCNQGTFTTALAARFRLLLCLWEAGNTELIFVNRTYYTKQMGEFVQFEPARRRVGTVAVSLADDCIGRINELAQAPTISEWLANETEDTCPLVNSGATPAVDWNVPIPLVFGLPRVACIVPALKRSELLLTEFTSSLAGDGFDTTGPAYGPVQMRQLMAFVVCATTDADDVTANDAFSLEVTFKERLFGVPELGGQDLAIPKRFVNRVTQSGSTSAHEYTIWSPQKGATITKDGRDWRVLWIAFSPSMYAQWFQQTFNKQSNTDDGSGGNNPVTTYVPLAGDAYESVAGIYEGFTEQSIYAIMSAFAKVTVKGRPFSSRTNKTQTQQIAPDILEDLIAYYSAGADTGDIHDASFNIARGVAGNLFLGGVVGEFPPPAQPGSTRSAASPVRPLRTGQLRSAIADICASADLDIFVDSDGLYRLSCRAFDYATLMATHPAIQETRTVDYEEQLPVAGERWAPYNRVYVVSALNERLGPYDNAAFVTSWGQILERQIQGKWMVDLGTDYAEQALLGIWGLRNLESKARPIVRFRTDKAALALQLSDYFTVSQTRGALEGPYVDTIFRVEQMQIDPQSLVVDLEAVWVDDLASETPYLLDDEDTSLVTDGTVAPATATVTDSSDTVTFSASTLADVQPGDILVLKDASLADDVFTRFRALRVATTDNDTVLTVDDADLDFDAPGGVAVADWEIHRGATTYFILQTSDPTNYPTSRDTEVYGKTSDGNDDFSDASNANTLQGG